MNYKSVTLISIILTAIFIMPLFSFSEDGTAPGTPFQALQEQIDDLQQQINDLQQGCIPAAYFTGTPETVKVPVPQEPEDQVDSVIVMQIQLPKGSYVSNISLGPQYGDKGFDPGCWAYLDCIIVDGDTANQIAGGVAGNAVGIMSLSSTEILTLEKEITTVALSCLGASPLCSYEPYPDIWVNGSWTFIEVDPQ